MKLYGHQIKGLARGKQGNCLFNWECGTGKTALALSLINYYRGRGNGPALVICPLSIIEPAWVADCDKFFSELSIASLWGKKPADRRKRLAENHDVYVANFETLKALYNDIAEKGFDVLIVDESSKMKNPKSQITRALLSLAGIKFRGSKFKTDRIIPHRYCLSGTPAPNDESEYWPQVKFVTGPGGQCLHDNFYAFRAQYFQRIPLGLTGQAMYKFRESQRPQFLESLSPAVDVLRKADCLDLPEQVHEIRKVFLSPRERDAYDTMKNDLVLQFGDSMVLSQTALVEIAKLRQLTSGFIYGEETYQIGQSKIKALQELLEEIGEHQVIIWANYKHEIQSLLYELSRPGGRYCQGIAEGLWGETKHRDAIVGAFQRGECQYLIANPQSAGHGLTFTNCHYVVYFSLNYSYELQQQSQDRCHRIGQKHKVTYFYLVADKTIDETILRTLQRKGKFAAEAMSYLKGGSPRAKIISTA